MENITKTGKFLEILIAILFVASGVALRLLPHPPNFSPIMAIALFSGVYLSKRTAFTIPIAAMIVSDVFLGFYDFKLLSVVYLGVILCVILGILLKKYKNWKTTALSALSGSIIFFVITNFAVWAFYGWYPKNLIGIVNCYIAALPFFKNSLIGDLFFVAVFFGAYELAKVLVQKKFAVKTNLIKNNI